jgi:hypothetical protein
MVRKCIWRFLDLKRLNNILEEGEGAGHLDLLSSLKHWEIDIF